MLQRIDFNKLDTVALKRYRRFHQLDDIGANPTKEELVSAVGRHFNAQVSFGMRKSFSLGQSAVNSAAVLFMNTITIQIFAIC